MNGFFSSPLDYDTLCSHLGDLCDTYPSLELSYIGNSLLSRRIPMVSFGNRGGREVFFIAGHHASEWLCTGVLLCLLYELCEADRRSHKLEGVSIPYIRSARHVTVVPQLNVDGTDIQINSISPDCPLCDRLIRANGGMDFSRWQANARGVDLNHNYNARFYEYREIEQQMGLLSGAPTRYSGEFPESEPEVACVCNYLRFARPSLVLSLHSQGEVIYTETGKIKGADRIAQRLSCLCGYPIKTPDGSAAYGGLCDWYREEMGLPAFTFECGKGENPLPLSDGAGIYRRLRPALVGALTLV